MKKTTSSPRPTQPPRVPAPVVPQSSPRSMSTTLRDVLHFAGASQPLVSPLVSPISSLEDIVQDVPHTPAGLTPHEMLLNFKKFTQEFAEKHVQLAGQIDLLLSRQDADQIVVREHASTIEVLVKSHDQIAQNAARNNSKTDEVISTLESFKKRVLCSYYNSHYEEYYTL
jgi:hypothetical protein